ncbi:MAG: glycine cleavage system protein H [Pirellulaceae bacterium]
MSEPLVFMMGEFAAEFPTDRQYARNHMWALTSEGSIRFGFSAYAVRLLQDVYFLDWNLAAPAALRQQQEIGSIESKKAESSLYAPVSGQLTTFNDKLLADPSTINTDKYGQGWLFEVEPTELELPLLTAAEYIEHLDGVWKITQQTIKGQLN